MIHHCGWCRIGMGTQFSDALQDKVIQIVAPGTEISHGICTRCEELILVGAEPPKCTGCGKNWQVHGHTQCGDCLRKVMA